MERGFSLVELMIVLAIIAVLAGIGLPLYQQYVAKTQVASGLAEITSARALFESTILAEGATSFDLSKVGLPQATPRCGLVLYSGTDGYIRCVLKGNAAIAGKTVEIVRDAQAGWQCRVSQDMLPKYRPVGCI